MSGVAGVALQAVATPIVAAKEAIEEIATKSPSKSPVESTPPAIVDDSSLVQIVIDVVVEHTGYPADFIELDQDLEGELGIDTVKQAEIMADIRTKFSLPVDEDFVLSDYPTLNHMIAYIQRMTGGEVSQTLSSETTITQPESIAEPKKDLQPVSAVTTAGNEEIESKLIEVVVKHTGYPADFIEMDQDLEGELGIDTVKQAEIMAEVGIFSHYQLMKILF